jgi:hypothetical protein
VSVVEIQLTQGKTALVEAADAERVLQYKWHACCRATTWYAATSKERRKGRVVYLHRFILGARPHEHVDHINGNGLDNRRENLRICTNAENRRNMRLQRGVSQFKGVARDLRQPGRPWVAYINYDGRKINLGAYESEVDAARAYNAAAIKYHGQFASLNTIPGLSYEDSICAPVRNRKLGRPYRTRCTRPESTAGVGSRSNGTSV